LLARINRELDADFDVTEFEHEARVNHQNRSVEMHLRSTRRQTVNINAAELSVEFLEGETIWTESSHKYALQEVRDMAIATGFRCDAQWVDEQWPFAENLLVAE
jgi:L-histidine N-alpha-methyltransferase